MNGRMVRRCGHSFISYNEIPVHLIPSVGKMTLCGTRIAYIYVSTPNQEKCSFGIAHLSFRRALRILKTYHRVKKEFFWDGLKSDVQKFMEECLVCQQNKVETIKTLGLLQPLAIPSQHWEEVSMDFIMGLPKSEGKSVNMVVVDRYQACTLLCTITPFQC
jgi:hypothetical protein